MLASPSMAAGFDRAPLARCVRAFCLLALAVVFPRVAAAGSAGEPGAPVATLLDRVVAVVDEDPILSSDIDRVVGLGLVEKKPDESVDLLRRRVLDQLIEQRLRSHAVDRAGFVEVPVDEIEKQTAEIRSRFRDEAELDRRLTELGMTRAALSQLVARQIAILVYIDERLGPRVFVSLDDIRAYYDATLVPELEKRGEKAPPLDDVREEIRTVLKEQRLNDELARWSEELRRNADVESFYDEPVDHLPPVLHITGKPR